VRVGGSLAGTLLENRRSRSLTGLDGGFLRPALISPQCIVMKTKGRKKSFKKGEIALDKNSECGTLSLVEKHASAIAGAFCF
jgi:hypothetical protein